jgi:leucine efflux protein
LIRSALASWRSPGETQQAAPLPDASNPFRTAMLISLMNPKAILFFVSFFIQFVAPDYPRPELAFLILGIIVQICSAIYLSVLIVGGVHLAAQFRQRRRFAALGTAAVGVLFIGFGVRLIGATIG